jgi:hypothetical protein
VLLEQLAAQPVGLGAGDREPVAVVAGAHVALADLGQLDDAAVLLDQPRGAREGHELARSAERVVEAGREQVLAGELGQELLEPHTLALVDRPQQPVGLADAGGRDGTHRPTLTGARRKRAIRRAADRAPRQR